jgi:hypothetical protein
MPCKQAADKVETLQTTREHLNAISLILQIVKNMLLKATKLIIAGNAQVENASRKLAGRQASKTVQVEARVNRRKPASCGPAPIEISKSQSKEQKRIRHGYCHTTS